MTADDEQLGALDTAPGSVARNQDLWQGLQSYLIGFVLSVLLTVLAFYFTGSDWVWGPSIPVALSVLAVAQIGVHLAFFLHLTTAPDSVNNSLALAFGTLIVALVIGGTLWIMYHMNQNMPPMTTQMSPAIAASPTAAGVVEAVRPTPIAAKVGGVVRLVDCDVGRRVRQGELCATIDARPLEQAAAQSETALRAAQARVKQDQAGLVTAKARAARSPIAAKRLDALQRALDRDEQSVVTAQQERDAARARLDDAKIVAPIDGVVVARNIEQGQAVEANSKQPLFQFAPDTRTVEVKVQGLPQSLASLRPGEKVTVTVDELHGESFEGEVAQLGDQLVVKVANPNAALKPGMKAAVRLPAR